MTAATITAATWSRIRVAYIDAWPRVTFSGLAEEHGASRHAIASRAKREGWERAARLTWARARLEHATAELAFAREQGRDVARAILRFCGDKRLPLGRLAAEAWEAHNAVSYVWSAAHWYAREARNLKDAEAGRTREEPRVPALAKLTDPAPSAAGRWPWYGHGPRKPFPWERRRK